MTAYALQVAHAGQRSIVRTARQPANIVFALVFPLALLAVNSGGLNPATEIPGFPTDSFVAFALAVPFVQGALFSTMNAGTDLARDIQTGFLDRLGLTPMRGSALIAGQLVGVATLGFVQAHRLRDRRTARRGGLRDGPGRHGRHPRAGDALRDRLRRDRHAARAADRLRRGHPGIFPFLFALLFISSMNMARDLIEVDWFRTAATLNPVSYMLEGIRSARHHRLGRAGARARASAIALAVVAVAPAAGALRPERLTRT